MLSVNKELLLPSITVDLCYCFLVSFFSDPKAFLLLPSFMPFSMLLTLLRYPFFFCFYHLRSDDAIDSAVLFSCFKGRVLCLRHVSPYVAEIQDGSFSFLCQALVGDDVYVFFEKI